MKTLNRELSRRNVHCGTSQWLHLEDERDIILRISRGTIAQACANHAPVRKNKGARRLRMLGVRAIVTGKIPLAERFGREEFFNII